jgi:hypothetical protein
MPRNVRKKGEMKLYRNTGVTALVPDGVRCEPGSEFRAQLDPDLEMQWLVGGHIEILQDQTEKADRQEAAAAGEVPAESSKRKR